MRQSWETTTSVSAGHIERRREEELGERVMGTGGGRGEVAVLRKIEERFKDTRREREREREKGGGVKDRE